jgi:hypothetical protein
MAPRIEPLGGNAMTVAGDTPLVPGQPVSPAAAAGHWVAANASVDAAGFATHRGRYS